MRLRGRRTLVVLAVALALGGVARAAPPRLAPRQKFAQAAARLWTMTERAATLPAFVWPLTKVADRLAHGEPLAGLTPRSAARVASEVARARGTGVVIGRLAWELHDPWSTAGAERSYRALVGELVAARRTEPRLDAAVSFDPETLGLRLSGVSEGRRRRIAGDAIVRLARAAHAHGLAVELDMGTSDAMPHTLAIAHRLVEELHIPVRLALAARYHASEAALRAWAALARRTGLRLGVRLVKGSFIEADNPDALHQRGPLLAQYRRLITLALEHAGAVDVAVATHNPEIWAHARREARRLRVPVVMEAVRGINPALQAEARRTGQLAREFLSYGVDAPAMALHELLHNWRQQRLLRRQGIEDID